jgi:hypothetical protein
MARGDLTVFEEASLDFMNGVHNLGSDTIYVGLIDDTTAPTAADATPRWADYSANEVSTAGNYTANGVALTGTGSSEAAGVATFDDTGNVSISQDASGFTDAYYAIIYNGDATNDEAIAFVDLGGPVSEQDGDVSITWNASGILTITVS